MSSIVLELQQDALNRNVLTSDLLRKALVVARKLRVQEIQTWLDLELNGYGDGADIPDYRKIWGEVRAWNPYHGWQPVVFQNAKIETLVKTRTCSQAAAELESLVSSGESGGELSCLLQAPKRDSFTRRLASQPTSPFSCRPRPSLGY